MRSVKQKVLAGLLTAAMLCTFVAPVYAADATVLAVDVPTATETAAVDTSKYTYTALPQEPMKNSVTVCSQQSEKLAAQLAFDGNPATYWHNKWAGDADRWIQWELGGTYNVGRLEYTRRPGNNKDGDLNGKWDTIKVEVTTGAAEAESSTWTKVFEGSLESCYEHADDQELANVATINFEPVEASAIKVTITKAKTTGEDKFANAAELVVYKAEANKPDQPEKPDVVEPEETVSNVAEVNGTSYKTLAEAFAAAKQNSTVKLLSNVTLGAEDAAIEVATKLTLDLNNFALVGSGKTVFHVAEAGDLTVQDSSTAKEGYIAGIYTDNDLTMKADSLVETIRVNGTLTVESGSIYGAVATGTVTNPNAIAVSALTGTVTVNGGEVWGVRAANTASKGNLNAIRVNSDATLNLTGNAVIGAAKVDTNAQDADYIALKNDGTAVIDGKAVVYGIHAGAKVSTAKVDTMNVGMNVIDSTKSLSIGGEASVLAAVGTDLEDAEIRAIAARGDLTLEGGVVKGNSKFGAIVLTNAHFVARESENAVPVVENQKGSAVAFAKNYPDATYEITGGIFKTPAVSEQFTDLNGVVASGYTTEKGDWNGETWTQSENGNYLKVVKGSDEPVKAGWVEVEDGWKYRNEDGSYHTGWLRLNDSWFYMDENGVMQTGWQQLNGNWFYMDENGVMQTGWQQLNGNWFYMDENGYMLTGWQYLGGNWFYMDESGHMLTGWQYLNNNWFYMDESGHMLTGWQQLNGNWFYFDESGHMLTGWQYIGGNWFYMNESGHMQTGWLYLGGNWFYMNASGHMVTGWQYIDGTWYNFNASGHML